MDTIYDQPLATALLVAYHYNDYSSDAEQQEYISLDEHNEAFNPFLTENLITV